MSAGGWKHFRATEIALRWRKVGVNEELMGTRVGYKIGPLTAPQLNSSSEFGSLRTLISNYRQMDGDRRRI